MKKPVLLLPFIFYASLLFGQSLNLAVTNTAGQSFERDGLHIEWSLGEMALVETYGHAATGVQLTNGLLQPNLVVQQPDPSFAEGEIRIRPNPTFNTAEINILTAQKGVLTIHVFDASGKNLVTRRLISSGFGNTERIDLLPYAAGTYYFQIELVPSQGSVRKKGTFKIVKL